MFSHKVDSPQGSFLRSCHFHTTVLEKLQFCPQECSGVELAEMVSKFKDEGRSDGSRHREMSKAEMSFYKAEPACPSDLRKTIMNSSAHGGYRFKPALTMD